MNQRLFCYVGSDQGEWQVDQQTCLVGEPLSNVRAIHICQPEVVEQQDSVSWILRGVTSNERYVQKTEKQTLVAAQEPIGRPESNRAALIPIRKSSAWWGLSQEERRQIFEESSRHIAIGLQYLPAIARRLHHCRDLATAEPFDFLTYFEFREQDESAFEELLLQLRKTEEWRFVDREIDIRLHRNIVP